MTKDVNVIIDIERPAGLTNLGTPLILAQKEGAPSFKLYADMDGVKVDFTEDTDAYKAAYVAFNQGAESTAQVAIATFNADVTAAETLQNYYDEDWYFVVLATGAVIDMIAVSDVVEGKGFKIAGHTVNSIDDLTTLSAKKYKRTFVMMHDKLEQYPHLALIGGHGSKVVGSVTYKFKKLVGVDVAPYDATTINAIHALNGFAYVLKNKVPQTSEGTMLDGEFIDIAHKADWVKVTMENKIANLFVTNDIVGFDDFSGIPQIEGEAITTLETAGKNGIIAKDADGILLYTVTAAPRAESSAEERQARVYNGLSFDFDVRGAIHKTTVRGGMKK